MQVTIRTRFASAVAEAGQDVFTRSYTEGEALSLSSNLELLRHGLDGDLVMLRKECA
ncbi:hypothetical protein QUF72_15665 [Desulfobacterales bacterium HSG2]|nr:hypothetical protein [Desulfobacterales bacterium HSG2]